MRHPITVGLLVLAIAPLSPLAAQTDQASAEKIANALSAAPEPIAAGAAVYDWPGASETETVVLRAGTNGWTCFPSRSEFAADAPICMDEAQLEVQLARLRGDPAELDRVGLQYMLRGGPAVDAQGRRTLGPHVMISFPGDGDLLAGLPRESRQSQPWVTELSPGVPVLIIPVAPPGEAAP